MSEDSPDVQNDLDDDDSLKRAFNLWALGFVGAILLAIGFFVERDSMGFFVHFAIICMAVTFLAVAVAVYSLFLGCVAMMAVTGVMVVGVFVEEVPLSALSLTGLIATALMVVSEWIAELATRRSIRRERAAKEALNPNH